MGKLDRRHSLKMKRRKAQTAKKRREKTTKVEKVSAEAPAPVKKSRAPKAPATPPPAAAS